MKRTAMALLMTAFFSATSFAVAGTCDVDTLCDLSQDVRKQEIALALSMLSSTSCNGPDLQAAISAVQNASSQAVSVQDFFCSSNPNTDAGASAAGSAAGACHTAYRKIASLVNNGCNDPRAEAARDAMLQARDEYTWIRYLANQNCN